MGGGAITMFLGVYMLFYLITAVYVDIYLFMYM